MFAIVEVMLCIMFRFLKYNLIISKIYVYF